MNLPDLVHAVLLGDLLAARQWVADAYRAQLQWPACGRPLGLDNREMTVAAALAELLAARAGVAAPSWTATVGANSEPQRAVVEAWKSAGIDLLLFQDGVGEGKVAIEDIALYYGPLDAAVRRAGGQLGAVVELFSLMPDGRRVPALIGRIHEQIATAGRLTSFPPVAFSVPDYMSSLAGQQAGGLLTNFLATQKRCRG